MNSPANTLLLHHPLDEVIRLISFILLFAKSICGLQGRRSSPGLLWLLDSVLLRSPRAIHSQSTTVCCLNAPLKTAAAAPVFGNKTSWLYSAVATIPPPPPPLWRNKNCCGWIWWGSLYVDGRIPRFANKEVTSKLQVIEI